MVLTIIIAFIALMGLIVLHEFGHFIMAKRFGVLVEEFGVGLPPRVIGKKIGETIYSINLLPFGAFVKLYGEEENIKNPLSFSAKPIWQRAIIVLSGVISFWIISAILLSFIQWSGFPQTISDEAGQNLTNPRVQIITVVKDSPAEKAGLKIGDTIEKLSIDNQQLTVTKVKEVQEFIEQNKGREVVLTIDRGKETFNTSLAPRVSPPEKEGAMGVALARTAIIRYSWYKAPWQGILMTGNLTIIVIQGWWQAISNAVQGQPTGVQIIGPVGIFGLLTDISQLGINYFLNFIAVISIYMALLNILPIPAFDGGKLMFLLIEKIRGKPIPTAIEQRVTAFFFIALIALMIFVTFKDIQRFFF
jgi:regulator of sigma E protease